MGATVRKIEIDMDSSETFEEFLTVLVKLGKVKKVERNDLRIEGKMKFGLQSVPIKIRISETSNKMSVVEILAWSDDLWSYAAKDCISRLLNLLGNPTRELEQKDLLGMKPIYLGLLATAFYSLLRYIIFPTLELNGLWDYAAIFGVVVIIYFIISRIRFSKM